MSEGEGRTQEAGGGREIGAKRIFGWLLSGFGILITIPGLLDVNQVGLFVILGGLSGAVGALLGARRLGIAAVVVSVAVLLLGLAMVYQLVPPLVEPPGIQEPPR